MQDLSELISKRQFLLGETDIPDISHESGVYIKATHEGIIVFWENSNTIGEQLNGKQEFNIKIRKNDIVSIRAFPKQDIHESDNSWNTEHYPELVINHRDPYEVVDAFTTKFRSGESYWIKALAKYLSEQLNITIEKE